MLIIVEGVDCTGKTWVATQLVKKLENAYLLKYGYKPRSNLVEERARLQDVYETVLSLYFELENHGGILILDRYFPSELIYSLVKRGYEALEAFYFIQLEERIKALPHLLIYVSASLSKIEERIIQRGEDYVSMEDIPKLMKRYEDYLRTRCPLDVIGVVNDSLINVDFLVKQIEEYKIEHS